MSAASGGGVAAPARFDVLGVMVSAVNMETAVSTLVESASKRTGGYVCVTGVHGVMESQRDHSLREVHNGSLLTVPDGMPMVWMGRVQRNPDVGRVYGPDMMLEVCRASITFGLTSFLLGGGDGLAPVLKESLEQRFPGIQIVGIQTPPFRPYTQEEEDALVTRLRELSPSFVWVGLSTPKQERLAARLSALVPGSIFLGVGAAFDMNAGRLRQAPRWMQRVGLEWLFRLVVEPRRLWRRYLRNNPEFILRAVAQLASGGTRR